MTISMTRKQAAGAGFIGLLLMLSACGSSSSKASSSSTALSAGSSATIAAGGSSGSLSAVQQALAAHQAVPAFQAPGPAINVASLKGKTVYSIPQSSAIPFLATTEQAEAAIAKHYGLNFVEYPTQGTPDGWIRGIGQAVATHASGLLLNALDPRLVGPQLQQAKSAGIAISSAQFFDLSQTAQAPSTLGAVRADDFTEAAKLEADWTISDTGGHADVVVVENQEQLSTVAMVDALKSEFAQYCPSCKVQYLNVPSTDWATKIQPDVQSALAADPGINYVIPIYDPMSQFVIPAITAAGKTGSVHIATFNGTPFALKDLAQGNVIRMDIGENLDWLASANMDEVFRAMLGQPGVSNEHTALRVFTKDNISDTGNPPAYNLGFGSAYTSGYRQLWGSGT
jgi:ribose transport system substrate-binding protein